MVEIQVQLTSATLACQTAMLDLINACIQELKRCTTAVCMKIQTLQGFFQLMWFIFFACKKIGDTFVMVQL